ncbi:hypothetical protein ACFFIY_02655 [Bhargavaea ullalensis]|uniref:Small secreted protein n=1 Tax=Bhargavaea ullalensis TaxID=1265685 RepID=A0ABV2GBW0_9BACL
MTAKWKILSLSAVAALMLAACNTGGDKGASADPSGDGDAVTEENNTGTDTETDSGNSENADKEGGTEDQQEPDKQEERGPDRELVYQKDGSEQRGKAVLTDSDEQDYSVYLLDGFELTSEEPGRDSLYSTEDEQNFMRIEVFGEDGSDYTNTVTTMEETLKSTGADPEEVIGKYSLAEDPSVEELVLKQAKSDEVLMTGAVFVTSGKIVRLTVFDKPDGAMTDAFLTMGATVGPKK